MSPIQERKFEQENKFEVEIWIWIYGGKRELRLIKIHFSHLLNVMCLFRSDG